jgi:hypothetical protein
MTYAYGERESNGEHILVENRKKRFSGNIEHPHDGTQLMWQTAKSNPFIVKE